MFDKMIRCEFIIGLNTFCAVLRNTGILRTEELPYRGKLFSSVDSWLHTMRPGRQSLTLLHLQQQN